MVLIASWACVSLNSAADDKQVSYSVAVPVAKTAASQAVSSASPYKAPAPVIRPVADAASQPVIAKPKKASPKATDTKPSASKKSGSTAKTNSTAKTTTTTTKKSPQVTKKASTSKQPTSTKVQPNKKSGSKPLTPVNRAEVATVKNAAVNKPVAPQPKLEPQKTDSLRAAPDMATNTQMNTGSQPADSTRATPARIPAAAIPLAAATATTALVANNTQAKAQDSVVQPLPNAPAIGSKETFSEESLDDLPESDLPLATPVVHKPLAVGGPQEEFVEKFKDYVEESIVPRVPGLALAIIANGQVRVLEAYGVKKSGGKDEITTDTVFRLASVSKTIAGTAAGVLVHSGAASWDTPVTSVLPDVSFSNPKYEAQLTLGHIMSQSTGLPTHSGDNYLEEGQSFDEVVDRLKKISFVCPPGKCYAYQNISFSLLSPIIKKKTGKSYEDYVKEKLFTPLGMRTASYGYDGLVGTRNYAQPHVLVGKGKWYTANVTEHYYRINPAAGANASITDLSRWVLAQMGNNPEVLPPAVLNSIHDHVTKNTPSQSHYGARDGVTNTYYGMGWRMFDYRGDKHFLHHGGYVLGYRSEMVYNPELKIGMVALSNCNRLSGEIIFRFLDAYEDQKRGPMPKKAPPPAKKKKK